MNAGRTWLGVGFGVGAGALWGVVLLAPELVRDFTALQLSAGRYLAYGVFAALLVAARWRSLVTKLGGREWRALAWLSLSGNIVYYVLLASGVQYGGIAMTSLVVGLLPVAITVIGSRDEGAVPLLRLAPSLLLGAAGILCISWQSLGAVSSAARTGNAVGLACALGALASWTAYAVGNSRSLARLDHVSAHEWSLLIGVVTGVEALALVPPALFMGAHRHGVGQWMHFSAVAAGVAILASIVGNAFWNRMCRLLPLTLVGQMVLFETLFALLYGFLWERRAPTTLELAAMAFVIASVASCIFAHRAEAGGSPT